MTRISEHASAEQKIYARWLDVGTKLGYVALLVTFLVHLFEIVPPGIAHEHLPRYWHLPVEEFIALTGAPKGWAWVARLGEADLLNFIGIVILAGISVVCYARLIPLFVRARERVFVAICVAEIVVLMVAATGMVGGGH